ncbi:hypothetical protein [Trichoplusia ni ascovirus 6b]|nr:hypothetical protein [Trichoplusia ni ascovirus 6b]
MDKTYNLPSLYKLSAQSIASKVAFDENRQNYRHEFNVVERVNTWQTKWLFWKKRSEEKEKKKLLLSYRLKCLQRLKDYSLPAVKVLVCDNYGNWIDCELCELLRSPEGTLHKYEKYYDEIAEILQTPSGYIFNDYDRICNSRNRNMEYYNSLKIKDKQHGTHEALEYIIMSYFRLGLCNVENVIKNYVKKQRIAEFMKLYCSII